MKPVNTTYKVSGDDIIMWLEQDSSIHIKASNGYNDPIELNLSEAKELHKKLQKLIQMLEEKIDE